MWCKLVMVSVLAVAWWVLGCGCCDYCGGSRKEDSDMVVKWLGVRVLTAVL